MDIKTPYQPGDRLWVKETWSIEDASHIYKSDLFNWGYAEIPRWQSPIYMPKEATRTWLEVDEVGVGRVQDITCVDAIAEGFGPYCNSLNIDCDTTDPREMFLDYWSKKGFDLKSNPWVWVVKFHMIER